MAIESHLNDPFLQSLDAMRQHLEDESNRRKMVAQQSVRATADGLRQRAQQQESADNMKIAQSMTGKAGQAYAAAHAGSAANDSARGAGGGAAPDQGAADESHLEPGDLDDLAAQEEGDSLGRNVGNQMSGDAVSKAALEQRKQHYRESEAAPDVDEAADRQRISDYTNAKERAAHDVRLQDGVSDTLHQMSTPPAPPGPQSMAPGKAALQAKMDAAMGRSVGLTNAIPSSATAPGFGFDPSARQPSDPALLAQIAAISGQPQGAPATATMSMPEVNMSALDAARARPAVDPQFEAFMASQGAPIR